MSSRPDLVKKAPLGSSETQAFLPCLSPYMRGEVEEGDMGGLLEEERRRRGEASGVEIPGGDWRRGTRGRGEEEGRRRRRGWGGGGGWVEEGVMSLYACIYMCIYISPCHACLYA